MNTEAMGLENKEFCDKDQWQCMYTWEFFVYIFFGTRKTPTQKIFTNQTFPWWVPPGKFSLGIFPPMFLNIPARACNFFFSLLLSLSLILLKRLFCKSTFQKFWSLYICQNEVLSEERQLMKWVVIILVRIF